MYEIRLDYEQEEPTINPVAAGHEGSSEGPMIEDDIKSIRDHNESNDILQLVGFKLGGEEYGIDILKVQEINKVLDITVIPQSPEFVEGIINLRGEVIPVIDLRKRFGLEVSEQDQHTRIVVVEVTGSTVGFIVDSVTEVIRLPKNKVEPPPPIVSGEKAEFISGVGKIEDKLLMLLDIEKILTESEQKQMGEFERN